MFPNTIASGINGVDTFLPIDKIIYFPIISQTPTLWACFVVVFASLSRTEAPCFSIHALLQAQGITGLLCFPVPPMLSACLLFLVSVEQEQEGRSQS